MTTKSNSIPPAPTLTHILFNKTTHQAASDAVCGFLPASVSSPVSNPAINSMANKVGWMASKKGVNAVTCLVGWITSKEGVDG